MIGSTFIVIITTTIIPTSLIITSVITKVMKINKYIRVIFFKKAQIFLIIIDAFFNAIQKLPFTIKFTYLGKCKIDLYIYIYIYIYKSEKQLKSNKRINKTTVKSNGKIFPIYN